MKTNIYSKLILVLLTFSTIMPGCSKNSSSAEEIVINQAVSMEIFNQLLTEIFTMSFGLFKETDGISETAYVPAVHFSTQNISDSFPCDLGGNILVTGSMTNTTNNEGNGSFSFDIKQKPNNCVIGTTQGNFTVNGSPDISFQAASSVQDWQFVGTYSFTIQGGYNWSGSGSSGSCSIDMAYIYNWSTQQFSMSGTMCGYNYS